MNPLSKVSRGYTLLEMIVAVGIFAVVMLAATGAYLSLLKLDRHARGVNDVVANLSFAVDSMARSIRTGVTYSCSPGDANGNNTNGTCTQLTFLDSEVPRRTVVYRLQGQQVIAQITPQGGSTITAALTDPRIRVDALTFYVQGVGTGDGVQPQVIMSLKGTMAAGQNASTTFSIQSTATQRLLEL
jgi:prepilin-type N-terminal cleavage/methylation domain-containing protein